MHLTTIDATRVNRRAAMAGIAAVGASATIPAARRSVEAEAFGPFPTIDAPMTEHSDEPVRTWPFYGPEGPRPGAFADWISQSNVAILAGRPMSPDLHGLFVSIDRKGGDLVMNEGIDEDTRYRIERHVLSMVDCGLPHRIVVYHTRSDTRDFEIHVITDADRLLDEAGTA